MIFIVRYVRVPYFNEKFGTGIQTGITDSNELLTNTHQQEHLANNNTRTSNKIRLFVVRSKQTTHNVARSCLGFEKPNPWSGKGFFVHRCRRRFVDIGSPATAALFTTKRLRFFGAISSGSRKRKWQYLQQHEPLRGCSFSQGCGIDQQRQPSNPACDRLWVGGRKPTLQKLCFSRRVRQ